MNSKTIKLEMPHKPRINLPEALKLKEASLLLPHVSKNYKKLYKLVEITPDNKQVIDHQFIFS